MSRTEDELSTPGLEASGSLRRDGFPTRGALTNSLKATISHWAGRALAAAIRARLGAVLHGVLARGSQADS
jgi:hypothetical protein